MTYAIKMSKEEVEATSVAICYWADTMRAEIQDPKGLEDLIRPIQDVNLKLYKAIAGDLEDDHLMQDVHTNKRFR